MIVTIVTPSMNGIEYLPECIASVRAQESERISIEHVFVDGGSTDGTPEYARSKGCTVITREERSLFAALNKGFSQANGTLLGNLGCDDLLLPGAVETVIRHHDRTGARCLMGAVQWLSERGPRGVFKPPPRWISAAMLASLDWSCVPHISTFLQKDLFEELGGFDGRFMYAGDYEFFARMLARREPFARIRSPLAAWRLHASNMSRTGKDPSLRSEIEAVQRRHAPVAAWERKFYRYLLKLWLNGASPAWSAHKRIDALRVRP